MTVQNKLKKAYSNQFNKYYGKKLNDEQLKVYMDFFLRKELDAKKVSSVCNIPFNESFSDRESFARHFKFIYKCHLQLHHNYIAFFKITLFKLKTIVFSVN